jgi:hypothetical protein
VCKTELLPFDLPQQDAFLQDKCTWSKSKHDSRTHCALNDANQQVLPAVPLASYVTLYVHEVNRDCLRLVLWFR